jgi:glycosidase
LWDLGEFNQKSTTRTKYGTIDELKDLAQVAAAKDMSLYFDAVLNHKAAADSQQKCKGIQVDWNGRFREDNADYRSQQDNWRRTGYQSLGLFQFSWTQQHLFGYDLAMVSFHRS